MAAMERVRPEPLQGRWRVVAHVGLVTLGFVLTLGLRIVQPQQAGAVRDTSGAD